MENSKEPGKKKVNEKDLETMSGGCGYNPKKDEMFKSRLECENCDWCEVRDGNWAPCFTKKYKCPECGKNALTCVLVVQK